MFGFTYPYDLAKNAEITPVFKLIEKICDSVFSKKELYQHIVDAQLEKIYVNTTTVKLHTVMFLFKILLAVGDVTGKYSISLAEMKLFVVSAKKWSDYLMVTDAILRYREDADYRLKCNEQLSKFSDSRYNNLVSNHSCIDCSDNRLILIDTAVKAIRLKIANFENLSRAEIDRRMHEDYLAEPQDDDAGRNLGTGLQKIIYGAPGSGKSHVVRLEVGGRPHKRITFHPDTDYNSFVGAYKPVQDGDRIKYAFAPQQFANAYVKAWELYVKHPGEKYFLIIEEINRGNCAQIFGDIFQLLDRNEDGFSEYPVSVDSDFADFIKTTISNVGFIEDYLKYFEDNPTCEIIMLPPNLHIIATMNTSDQSLFPMDSAFKRRWEWVYVPIDYKDAGRFKIVLDDRHQYSWGEFIVAVNERIAVATGSPDKQLGNRFVHVGSDNIITLQQFQGKVLFYLWEEVFKDNRKYSIFDKEKGFFDIYNNIDEISHILEAKLGISNCAVSTDNDITSENEEG